MIYHVRLIGGPNDGEESICFRPYFRLYMNKCVYENDPYNEDFEEWVDDDTRRIKLFYNPNAEKKEKCQ